MVEYRCRSIGRAHQAVATEGQIDVQDSDVEQHFGGRSRPFPRDRYEIASEMANPDAVLVRSAKMHDMKLAPSVKAIGRAGAGVNNIPVDAMTAAGIPVFNAPGAERECGHELVVAGMLMAARNIGQAWQFATSLSGDDATINRDVEAGKKNFVGFELPGRTLGVIGLGAIGVKVANAARALGMKVIGYDPTITVRAAWALDSDVQQALSVDDLAARRTFITFHAADRHHPNMINADRLRLMKKLGAAQLRNATASSTTRRRSRHWNSGSCMPMSVISPATCSKTIRGSSPCRTWAHRLPRPRKTAL